MNNLISAFIGALISIMTMFNGTLANNIGNYTANILIHTVGLLSIIIVLFIRKSKVKFDKSLPIYLYSAGVIGVFTVLFTNLSFSVLGVSIPLALGLLGQSVTSIVIDHFGLLDMQPIRFEKRKFIGLTFIVIGICVMIIF